MKKILVVILLFLIPLQMVYAQELLFSVDQSEYFFKIGEDVVIPIKVENSFGKEISGILQYTVTQQINQGNVQFSNSNTNSNSFIVEDGNRIVSLNFGTADTPTTFVVNLNFNFNEGKDRTVALGPITVHFVDDESQKKNQSNPMQSSTQETSPDQQDPFSQQMQQKLDQLLGNQQTLPQDPQQRLQNNQMSQDSSALKQQIQEQLKQQENTQKEFEKLLSADPNFANKHQQMLQNGYNVTGGNINPISNNTGSFDIQYKNEGGEWAKIQGKMENGTITEIKSQSQEQQEDLLKKLEQNSQYQEFKKQLEQNKYSQINSNFRYDENETSVTVEYQSNNQDKASITGVFENGEIKSVTLDKKNSNTSDLFMLIVSLASILIAGIIGFFIYKKYSKKKAVKINIASKIQPVKPFDYISESRKLIVEAKQYYDNQEYKDAFGKAGRAIRLFLSYDIGQKKELTNEELIQLLSKEKYPVDEIGNALKITELVEFAKEENVKEEFKKIVSLFEKLI